MKKTAHRLFPGLRPPAAPESLRRRTLSAVRTAGRIGAHPAGRPHPVLTDRLWESRALRLAWALLLLGLLSANLALSRSRFAGAQDPVQARRGAPQGIPFGAQSSAAPAGLGDEPHTLLASRDEIFRAVLGGRTTDDTERPSAHPRRPS